MNRLIYFSLISIFFVTGLFAQHNDWCAHDYLLAKAIAEDPSIVERMEEAHRQNGLNLTANKNQQVPLVTIPVVFHIVYNTTAENISDAQIQSQLDVLNEDFNLNNPNFSNTVGAFQGVAGNVNIEFCLANMDPSGQPHSGINRKQNSKSCYDFQTEADDMKLANLDGIAAWPKSSYLNVWVVDICSGGSLTTLGYAYRPNVAPAIYDGFVIDYRYVGTTGTIVANNTGRVATHEIGHWLDLPHPWTNPTGMACASNCCGVDDGFTDTPNSDGPNYNCPLTHASCNSIDNVQNYMDYANGDCQTMFTQQQVTKMQNLLNNPSQTFGRGSLKNSMGCAGAVSIFDFQNDLKEVFTYFPNPTTGVVNIELNNDLPNKDFGINIFDLSGKLVYQKWDVTNGYDYGQFDISHLNDGVYIARLNNGNAVSGFKISLTR